MNALIKNIGLLVNVRDNDTLLHGGALSHLPCVTNAYLVIEDGRIAAYGGMNLFSDEIKSQKIIDANGCYVLPCWCDSHTHLVFAASREEEFVDKIKGLSYADIAAKGGGILNSASKLNAMHEDELFDLAFKKIK